MPKIYHWSSIIGPTTLTQISDNIMPSGFQHQQVYYTQRIVLYYSGQDKGQY